MEPHVTGIRGTRLPLQARSTHTNKNLRIIRYIDYASRKINPASINTDQNIGLEQFEPSVNVKNVFGKQSHEHRNAYQHT